LTLEKIRQGRFDSVFAPRDTHTSGGVFNDEFVIYDPDQALPKYIIHYCQNKDDQLEETLFYDESDDDDS
jgi:hypothetical protein